MAMSSECARCSKETLQGWAEDISKCSCWEALPENARKYVVRSALTEPFALLLCEDRRIAWHSGVLGALTLRDSSLLIFCLRLASAQIAAAC